MEAVDKVKFRASSVGQLMTLPRSKKDQEAGLLTAGGKTLVRELWLQNKYQFRDNVHSKEMTKGVQKEQESIDMLNRVLGMKFTKNFRAYENEYFKGTPDIVDEDTGLIVDIKTSWNIKTFMFAEVEKNYKYQLYSYMAMTGIKKAMLAFCLVDTPEAYILKEEQRVWYWYTDNVEDWESDEHHLKNYQSECAQIRLNHTYSRIPERHRIRTVILDWNEDEYEFMKSQARKGLAYYGTLVLNDKLVV